MKIEILGTGCPKCKMLMQLTRQAVEELNLSADIQKIEDLNTIMAYGVLSTPALVVDGQVKLAGHLVSAEKIKEILLQSNK